MPQTREVNECYVCVCVLCVEISSIKVLRAVASLVGCEHFGGGAGVLSNTRRHHLINQVPNAW